MADGERAESFTAKDAKDAKVTIIRLKEEARNASPLAKRSCFSI
jgi:hypothetical protein